jgi:hypothetical protein
MFSFTELSKIEDIAEIHLIVEIVILEIWLLLR